MTFVTTGDDAQVMSDVEALTSDSPSSMVRSVVRWLATPLPATTLVLGLPIAVLMIAAVQRRAFMAAVAALGACAVVLAGTAVAGPEGVTGVASAFGQAAWEGLDADYGPRFLVLSSLLVLVVVGAAVLGTWLVHRRSVPRPAAVVESPAVLPGFRGLNTPVDDDLPADAGAAPPDTGSKRLARQVRLVVRFAHLLSPSCPSSPLSSRSHPCETSPDR